MIQLFHNLLSSGFTLTEIVTFLEHSQLLEKAYIQRLKEGLVAGQPLSQLLASVGFSTNLVTQLSLAEAHGNLEKSMSLIGDYLQQVIQVRKKLIEVATYPIILLSFLLFIMLGLKNYLLPQLTEGNLATALLNQFPMIFLGGSLFVATLALGIYSYSRSLSRIIWFTLLAKIPFIGKTLQLYLTAYYAREWGSLIGQGMELRQIIQIMQTQASPLFRELGESMEQQLVIGNSFHQSVISYPFFLKELGLMIEYGQVKSKLGQELTVYSGEIWEQFFIRLNKATQLIQPLIFIFVALVIVMIYAAMLLPMYQTMEVSI